MKQTDILVRVQETPNPFALKFITNFPLKIDESITYTSVKQCEHIPMAYEIMNLTGVVQVYFFENTLTVSFEQDTDRDLLKEYVSSIVKKTGVIHEASDLKKVETKKQKPKKMSKEIMEIDAILDRTIRPGLQADGGDIEVLEFKDHQVSVLYQGACQGCPSAFTGTLEAIEGILQNELKNDQIKVIPV